MRITKEDVEKIAELAKLDVSEDEIEMYRSHLDQILDYVQKLNELDTENIEPTYYVQHSGDVLREDKAKSSLPREKALENAPAQTKGFVRVPRVIPKERGDSSG